METQKVPESLVTPAISAASKAVRQRPSLSLLILVIPILLAYVSIAIQNWNVVFDDAFITYRYAQNLAMGHGITWNPGYPPTEGYTNFLLVLMLAPVIWAGLDPLLFTRVLSFICVIAISGILFTIARRRYNSSTTTASMVAAIIFLVPASEILCLVGLETVVYAFFLLITFIAGVVFIDRKQLSHSILFSCLLFLTMLLRPEAALLYPIISIAYLVEVVRNKAAWKPLIAGLLALLALGGIYLAWKYLHFGQLLPNPFYLKASGRTFISPDGLDSVKSFIRGYALLLILAFSSIILCFSLKSTEKPRNKTVALLGTIFVVVYCLFFTHVDTLMDAGGRFLYPLVPLVILLATPILAKALGFLESASKHRIIVLPIIMLAFLFAFGRSNILGMYGHINNIKRLAFNGNLQSRKTAVDPMQKEYLVAKALAEFPQIKEVRIAFADSGVIPYFTGAIWLDVVGLNDEFIAKTRNKNQLVDYFFIWSPDLVIQPGKFGLSWLQVGHGPLGDYLSWSNDRRWDEYEYVGTSILDGSIYDLQYFVKKSSRFHDSLAGFLKGNVVDGWYEPFPLPIGTYYPQRIQLSWWPRQ
jgi:arabinofuranosyltransferase